MTFVCNVARIILFFATVRHAGSVVKYTRERGNAVLTPNPEM